MTPGYFATLVEIFKPTSKTRYCEVCEKPLEMSYREIKGLGCVHPQCDPREKKDDAGRTNS